MKSNGGRHWFRWLLGVMVLAIFLTFLGVRLGSGSRGAEVSKPSSLAPDAEFGSYGEGVACFGHVDVKHGITSLYPTQPGRVAEVLVEEDQRVKAGDVLLRLEDTVAGLRVNEAQVDLEAAQIQLIEARKLPQQHQARIDQAQAGIAVVNKRLTSARQVCSRKEDLYAKNLTNKTDLDVSRNQVQEAEALLEAETKKLVELRLHDPAADVRRAEQEVKAREVRLRLAQDSLKECAVRAPQGGKVLRSLVGPGEMLGALPKQPVLLFCPDGPRFIRAEVVQEFAHQVKVGQPAVIRDDSNDPAVWRGRVTSLSDWYAQRRSVLQEPLQFNDVRTLECLIALDPGQAPLKIGQRVRVLIRPASYQSPGLDGQ